MQKNIHGQRKFRIFLPINGCFMQIHLTSWLKMFIPLSLCCSNQEAKIERYRNFLPTKVRFLQTLTCPIVQSLIVIHKNSKLNNINDGLGFAYAPKPNTSQERHSLTIHFPSEIPTEKHEEEDQFLTSREKRRKHILRVT